MIQLFCKRSPWQRSVEFVYTETWAHQNRFMVAEPLKLHEIPADTEMPAPTFALPEDGAQKLMDSLWREGFRPTEGTGSAGALAAVEKHLGDMRAIAFRYLEIGEDTDSAARVEKAVEKFESIVKEMRQGRNDDRTRV